VATGIKLVKTVPASASYASRTAVHHTLGVSPGAVPIFNDYNLIRESHQTLTDHNAATQNCPRYFRDYLIGNEVLIRAPNPAGLDPRGFGPYTIAQVHVNGTVTIERLNNLYEIINN
jgi:hypothetical protein